MKVKDLEEVKKCVEVRNVLMKMKTTKEDLHLSIKGDSFAGLSFKNKGSDFKVFLEKELEKINKEIQSFGVEL